MRFNHGLLLPLFFSGIGEYDNICHNTSRDLKMSVPLKNDAYLFCTYYKHNAIVIVVIIIMAVVRATAAALP